MPTPSTRRVGYSSLVFDTKAQRYRGENGRFLGKATQRDITDRDIEKRSARLQSLALRAARGEIDKAEARKLFAQNVKSVHLINAAVNKGGLHQMDNAAYGLVGQQLCKTHYPALDNLFQDFVNGRYTNADGSLNEDAIKRRVDWFAQAGRGTGALVAHKEHQAANFTIKWNEPDATAKHCDKGERSCVAMTDLKRVAIDDTRYLPEGFRVCGAECRCRTGYGKGELQVE